jgi:hypothetical protein
MFTSGFFVSSDSRKLSFSSGFDVYLAVLSGNTKSDSPWLFRNNCE